MKKTVTWILIADGNQARVLEHGGPGKGLLSVKGLDWSIPPLQTQDINADRPGRSLVIGWGTQRHAARDGELLGGAGQLGGSDDGHG